MRLYPKNLTSWLVSLAIIVGSVIAAVPTTQVKLNYYNYQNSVFSGQIYVCIVFIALAPWKNFVTDFVLFLQVENLAYTKVVTVIWSDANNNWSGSSVAASYYQSISGTNYEYWNFSTTIGSSGISEFYIEVQYLPNWIIYCVNADASHSYQ